MCEQHMPWRWKWLGDVVKLTHVMKELIAWDMTLSNVIKVEKIKTRLGSTDWLQVWRASGVMTWRQWTKATVKSKWSQDWWNNTVTWWYEVDHIIWWLIGACVASTMKEMEWNAQGKGITYRAFHFASHRCVEKFMTGFKIDSRIIKRDNLLVVTVI